MSNSPSSLTHSNNLQVYPSQVVVVYTEWNDAIINELVAGAKKIFDQYQGTVSYTLIQVPGCVEIPFTIHQYESLTKYRKPVDAYIAFGCVIRGETAHFDYVCQSVTQGITQLNVSIAAPTIYGILTVDNIQQAQDRIGGKHGHKGEEAAITALKMIHNKHLLRENLKSNKIK
jgi:6,7-dimethyl-8-ribityllumazine synthase